MWDFFTGNSLFMGRQGRLPGEEEQYRAYRRAVEGMQGLPVTIRTVDVGADKPLDDSLRRRYLNPALGLRAIRWSLADPAMFLTQLRAILRAAARGRSPARPHAGARQVNPAKLWPTWITRARLSTTVAWLAYGPSSSVP